MSKEIELIEKDIADATELVAKKLREFADDLNTRLEINPNGAAVLGSVDALRWGLGLFLQDLESAHTKWHELSGTLGVVRTSSANVTPSIDTGSVEMPITS